MRDARSTAARAAPAIAAAACVALLVGHLLAPSVLLMARDVATFHLPLRVAAVALAEADGLPEWNPWINGGQPVLSNPNYAWSYPPTWLALVVDPGYSLSLLVAAHAALALAGAWRLLRSLGCDRPAAGLGALAFAGSTWFLSLAHSFNFFCATAWLPWLLAAARALQQASRGAAFAPTVATGVVVALQLLAGEPVAVLVSAAALACVVAGEAPAARRTLPRLAAAAAVAALVAAVQLLPTAARLSGSARAGGLLAGEAGRWSASPARLVDFAFPHFWGHALRDEEGLWIGWGVHDEGFPYVIALYSGVLPLVLATTAVALWPIPWRRAWALAFGGGVFVGLGRHNPAWEPLRDALPLLDLVRYPEKFLVLSATVVPLAAALGWQHLRTASARGDRGPAIAASRVAAVLGVGAAGLLAAAAGLPQRTAAFVAAHSGLPPTPEAVSRVLGYLRQELAIGLCLALATAALLAAAARSGRVAALAPGLAVTLLAADLLWFGRGMLPTLPAASVLEPPPLARRAAARGGRLHVAEASHGEPEIRLRVGPPGFQQLLGRRARLDPYVAALWGVPYALNRDYDLMATPWARHGLAVLAAAPAGASRDSILGAWDVRTEVVPRAPSEVMRELRLMGRLPSEVLERASLGALPLLRFTPRLDRVEDPAAAASALAARAWDLAGGDACLGSGGPGAGDYAPAELLGATGSGQRLEVRYRAAGPAALVAAFTFDEGWEARADGGARLPTCPTLAGQLAVAVPPGEASVTLRYRDPWARVGAATSLATLLALAAAATRRRRRDTAAATPPAVESAP